MKNFSRKNFTLFPFVAALPFFLVSCTGMEKIAGGIARKNLSGNGTFISNSVGINANTKIPELKTTFISGDMASVLAGTNAISFREESSSSIWNAESVTEKRFLSITLTDKGDAASVIRELAEVLKTLPGTKN